ncbi:MAG: DUF4040 domain-containing protein [Nitrospirota bacterium]|jgi:multicomponent Na+:H+ antiporter subunit B
MMDFLLLMFLVLTATAAVFMGDLLAAGIMLSAYSLIMAVVWMSLNAVDVAFTEAAVGAGVTTVLLIAALSRTRRLEGRPVSRGKRFAGLLMVVLTGAVLMYGTLDMPAFGDPEAPAQRHVAPRYIEHSEEEAGVANMVTAVLASYRGYDTLGETTVIFTAGSSVILLIRRWRRKG